MNAKQKDFYLCYVTMHNLLGLDTIYNTYAIAASDDEAADIARQQAQQLFPTGWTISHINVGVFARDLLEQIAEEVLGWHRP